MLSLFSGVARQKCLELRTPETLDTMGPSPKRALNSNTDGQMVTWQTNEKANKVP